MRHILPREIETLWTLFTAPAVWALHFILCYVAVAIYCEKAGEWYIGFGTVRLVLGAITILALAMIVLSSYLAWRQWGFGSGDPPHDQPTAEDRRRFQGFATLLLYGLSFVAVVYVAIPLIFIHGCYQ
ncbi:hypothetical protein ACWGPT_01835 [Pseudorhizobium sp. NPDC055634]